MSKKLSLKISIVAAVWITLLFLLFWLGPWLAGFLAPEASYSEAVPLGGMLLLLTAVVIALVYWVTKLFCLLADKLVNKEK